uniref:Uncharacterized protein n=1 Tax=Caenorhabditis japonica TaxID=281687 RepID=A0A8R1IT55_CAEJA
MLFNVKRGEHKKKRNTLSKNLVSWHAANFYENNREKEKQIVDLIMRECGQACGRSDRPPRNVCRKKN